MLKIYLTNLGKYNEGYLIGKWIELPVSEEELEEELNNIGINEEYEEYFITDYETDVEGLKVGEYDNLEELNELAEKLEGMDDLEIEVLEAMLEEGFDFEEAVEKVHDGDYMVYSDCEDMEDVAMQYIEECGLLEDVPDYLQNYFDYEAFGRDMSYEGQYVFIGNDCIQIL